MGPIGPYMLHSLYGRVKVNRAILQSGAQVAREWLMNGFCQMVKWRSVLLSACADCS